MQLVAEKDKKWQRWLVSIGRDLWRIAPEGSLEKLTGTGRGQMGFAAILLPRLRKEVEALVEHRLPDQCVPCHYQGLGKVEPFEKHRQLRVA